MKRFLKSSLLSKIAPVKCFWPRSGNWEIYENFEKNFTIFLEDSGLMRERRMHGDVIFTLSKWRCYLVQNFRKVLCRILNVHFLHRYCPGDWLVVPPHCLPDERYQGFRQERSGWLARPDIGFWWLEPSEKTPEGFALQPRASTRHQRKICEQWDESRESRGKHVGLVARLQVALARLGFRV